jgi:hypothetical protein
MHFISRQLSGEWTLMRSFEPGVPEVHEWIGQNLEGQRVGVDPTVFDQAKAALWQSQWRGTTLV